MITVHLLFQFLYAVSNKKYKDSREIRTICDCQEGSMAVQN